MSIVQLDVAESLPYIRYAQYVYTNRYHLNIPNRILYDFEFIYVVKGELTVIEEDSTYIVSQNNFHIMPPFVKHKRSILNDNACEYFNFHFDFYHKKEDVDIDVQTVYVDPIVKHMENTQPIKSLMDRQIYVLKNIEIPKVVLCMNPQRVITLMTECLELYKEKDPYNMLQINGLFACIIGILLKDSINKKASFSGTVEDAVAKFVKYVDEYYYLEIKLEDIASSYGYSVSHFRRAFTEINGYSPKNYILSRRIEEAKLMLLGKYKINEIGYAVGFNDPVYFCQIFKNKVGLAPTQYRNTLNK